MEITTWHHASGGVNLVANTWPRHSVTIAGSKQCTHILAYGQNIALGGIQTNIVVEGGVAAPS